MITAEKPPLEAPPALPKHRYPLPIVLAAVITLAAAAYSFARAPALIDAGREMRAGQSALARGDYGTAVRELRAADAHAPTSHDITVSLAEAEFADNDPADAMRLLNGVKLSQSDWTALQQYMPAQYQKYFVRTS
jgi:thioredoxin-like negative regulator of GroEL